MPGEFCTGRGAGGVLLGEFCNGWGAGGVLLGEFCTGWGAGGVLPGEFCTGWGWEYGCVVSSGVRCERKFALLAELAPGARESSPCMSKMGEFC